MIFVGMKYLRLLALLVLASGAVRVSAQDTPPARTSERYRFGPDASFVVRGADIEEIGDKSFRVDSSGGVTLPLIGNVHAAGMTVGELESEINQRLKKFVKNPAVSVSVTEMQSNPVSVFGAVNSSGVQQVGGSKSLVEVLSLAGGLRGDAGNVLTVTRAVENGPLPLADAKLDDAGRFWVAKVDVATLLSSQRPQDNIRLLANDIVSVPKADLVYVIGDINHSGAIPLVGRLTVMQAVARSEGLQKSASKNIRILREVAGNTRHKEIAVDFQKVLNGKADDQELHPNDILIIPNNVSRSAALRMVEAAVQVGTGLIIWGP